MIFLITFFLFFFLALAGNYMECSENYCQNDGNCLVMSGSISSTNPDPSILNPENSRFFVANGNQQSWYKANVSCHEHGGKLFIHDRNSTAVNLEAQIFIQNYVSTDKVSGFWTGIGPDEENQCILLDQYGLLTRKFCSDTYDMETGALNLGLCQRSEGTTYTYCIL